MYGSMCFTASEKLGFDIEALGHQAVDLYAVRVGTN